MVDRTRHRDQTDPTSLALIVVPIAAAASDQRGQREAFDVLDERRAAAHSLVEGSRRCRRRPGITRVHEMNRRRLLAGDVAGWRWNHVGSSADVRRALGERVAHGRIRRPVFGTYIDDDVVGAHGTRREQGTVDDQVGSGRH